MEKKMETTIGPYLGNKGISDSDVLRLCKGKQDMDIIPI